MKKQKHKKSILHGKDGTCYLCMLLHDDFRIHKNLHYHHIFPGTANRKISEAEGLAVYLCLDHHELGPEAVHKNHDNMRLLQQVAQEKFEQRYGHDRFMELFKRNYTGGGEMNKVILMGRLTRDPDVRYTQANSRQESTCVARYSLAVNRRFKKEGGQDADFINCVAFGRQGEFAEKYLKQGTKVVISGRIQTGSYVNRDGVKVYTTDIVVEEQDFAESKAAAGKGDVSETPPKAQPSTDVGEGFMAIPEGIEEELPFI